MTDLTFEKFKDGTMVAVTKEHTFGTDAFLLADFAKIRHKDVVCDLCTGCGIIAVLMKIRYSPKMIYALDIQSQAIEQFNMTVEKSSLDNVIPLCMDLKNLTDKIPQGVFDAVTCNPPYKAAGAGIESTADAQKIARHEILCNISDVCVSAAKLLKYGGDFYVCNRPERLADVICAMRENNIEPKEIRFVSKSPDDAPWLFLISGKKCGKPFLKILPPLYINESGGLSDEMKSIYGNTMPKENV